MVLSILFNFGLVLALNSEFVHDLVFSRETPEPSAPASAQHVLQMVFATPDAEVPAEDEERRKRFARTTEEQRAETPENSNFIGERDTRAATELRPDAGAPDLPSQAGIDPRDEMDIETTESDFRDGPLDGPDVDVAPPVLAAMSQPPGVDVEVQSDSDAREPGRLDSPAPTQRLLEGPLATEIAVPMEPEPKVEENSPASEPVVAAPQGVAEAEVQDQSVVDPTQKSPGFRGHQRRTVIRGSISRTGPSSLDVQDNALGRYQAQISRAVELEWQRNCVRHRDFITPGFLTVRFFVEHTGRVRTVEFVGHMETGEVQKGFTLNSIRNAPIPTMPKELRRELNDEPLELIFNFYF